MQTGISGILGIPECPVVSSSFIYQGFRSTILSSFRFVSFFFSFFRFRSIRFMFGKRKKRREEKRKGKEMTGREEKMLGRGEISSLECKFSNSLLKVKATSIEKISPFSDSKFVGKKEFDVEKYAFTFKPNTSYYYFP